MKKKSLYERFEELMSSPMDEVKGMLVLALFVVMMSGGIMLVRNINATVPEVPERDPRVEECRIWCTANGMEMIEVAGIDHFRCRCVVSSYED